VIARGQLLMEMDLPGAALADFAKGTELGSEDPGAWHNLGELFRPERPAEALEAFDRAVALNPQSASSWTSRGITLRLLRRVDEALASLERALTLDPDDADAWFAKAAALAQLERDEEALAALERAMELDSDQFGASEDAWHLKGRCLMRLGRPDEAGTAFGTSLRLRHEARRRRRRGLFGRRREPEEP
jgi:tetratricopeptide (TPR) repeat protein